MAWTKESRERLISAMEDILRELDDWVRALGLSTAEIGRLYDGVVSENGFALNLIFGTAKTAIPNEFRPFGKVASYSEAVVYLRSPEFLTKIEESPEPNPQELTAVIQMCRDALPNLKRTLSESVSAGPRYKRGGRPLELNTPQIREKICQEIRDLRGPDSNLQDIFERLAKKYDVSATTIKRIWLKCPK